MTATLFYTLEGREPRALEGDQVVAALTWAKWFDNGDRRVCRSGVGRYSVRTDFLGLDMSYGYGRPLLFETMVFVPPGAEDAVPPSRRYATWEEAERGHAAVVAELETFLKRWGRYTGEE